MAPITTLFICTGNICRSPMAEMLWTTLSGLPASSAGTHAVVGEPMHPDAVQALHHLDLTPPSFRAQQMTPRLLLDADLVLVMTRTHLRAAQHAHPPSLRKIFGLREFVRLVRGGASSVADAHQLRQTHTAPALGDIKDPMGKPLAVFHETAQILHTALQDLHAQQHFSWEA